MKKKVGVLLVHGLGSVADDFAHDAIHELRERISGRGLNCEEVAFETVYWAPILAARETQLWVDLSADNDLNWAKLRRFFTNAFGTVSAYHSSIGKPDGLYDKVHSAVHDSLLELRKKLGGEDKPLLVMAHSLGSAIMSDYIWDRQKGKNGERFGGTPFERMETMAGLVTLGSNIPLFILSCESVLSIAFPPPALPEKFRKVAKWLNLYDSDDVLGWPLKPLSVAYNDAVTADMEVNVGNIFTSWNPANHAAYWSDDGVIKPSAYLLASILEACDR